VAEGITSYYEDLLLVRAGLITQDDFIKKFSGLISGLQRTEGRKVQSLRDSSHDAWIKFYRPTSNSRATQISYYTKGAVVSFLLDARIRTASDGKASLDTVLKNIFEKHAGNIGYLPSDFQAICSEVAGENLDSWFASAIDSTDELDYQFVADWFGLEIGDIKPKQSQVATEPVTANAVEPAKPESKAENDTSVNESPTATPAVPAKNKSTPWLGIGIPNSPASTAGLAENDEVIAINGIRVRSTEPTGTAGAARPSTADASAAVTRPRSATETFIQDFEVGQPIKILISRDDVIQEVLAVVGNLPETPNWGLSISKKATDEQKQHLATWLNQPLVENKSKPTAEAR
jgi:predicted metalloprotease with PDZ domain